MDISQIRAITMGAVRVEQNENGIDFFRFTEQQEALYKDRSEDFYVKSFSSSGVRLSFRTNSQTLFLRVEVAPGSSRRYFSLDVFVNGERMDSLDNFSSVELPQDYTKMGFPLGEFSKEFCLGTGEKNVCVYFPWSVKTTLKEFRLEEDSFVEPVRPAKKLLCFGDSITHGYDALRPSNKYITRLADMLDAEEYNKAIGGEIFFPDLAGAKDDFEPDYITVAYGTNDWNLCKKEQFDGNCREFLYNLRRNYPNSKIFAITPVWRKEMHEHRQFGLFKTVGESIKQQAAQVGGIFVIDGFTLIPQDENLYGDLRLHPNDHGFRLYFENLAKQIDALL